MVGQGGGGIGQRGWREGRIRLGCWTDNMVGMSCTRPMRSAQVQDSLCCRDVLDVSVLEQGRRRILLGRRQTLRGRRRTISQRTAVLVLDRVLETVGTEYPSVLVRPRPTGQVLRLTVLGRLELVLGVGVPSSHRIRGTFRTMKSGIRAVRTQEPGLKTVWTLEPGLETVRTLPPFPTF